MEKFQVAREQALKNLRIADHMLTVTYPVVNDPKLLLSVMGNLHNALENGVSMVLEYDRLFKKIPPFHDSFESKFQMFKNKCVPRYGIDASYLALIKEVKSILEEHKKSPVEFTRRNKFVICSDTYRMKTISIDDIKKNISKTKEFLNDMSGIVSKNERIFR